MHIPPVVLLKPKQHLPSLLSLWAPLWSMMSCISLPYPVFPCSRCCLLILCQVLTRNVLPPILGEDSHPAKDSEEYRPTTRSGSLLTSANCISCREHPPRKTQHTSHCREQSFIPRKEKKCSKISIYSVYQFPMASRSLLRAAMGWWPAYNLLYCMWTSCSLPRYASEAGQVPYDTHTSALQRIEVP